MHESWKDNVVYRWLQLGSFGQASSQPFLLPGPLE